MREPLLSIRNLQTVYHDVIRVLRGVSLDVPNGAIVALLGPNGAGKTTALRAITGLLDLHNGRIVKGQVLFEGTDLAGVRAERRVAMGIGQVLEGRRIFAELTVEENLMSGGWHRARADLVQDAARWLERFPILAQRRHQSAGYLSGGEQQMLAIARALMGAPRLLLLDEPSLGLAPKIVADVAALIREVHEEGVSVLLVEQNAALALELASQATVLETGRVVIEGSSERLMQDRDMQEFYLGTGEGNRRSFRDVKHYRRRRRWLS